MRKCPKCGTPSKEGQAFCLNCGMYLKGNQTRPDENSSYEPDQVPTSDDTYENGDTTRERPLWEEAFKNVQQGANNFQSYQIRRKRQQAGIAAILFGSLGLHYFIMEKRVPGMIFLASFVLGILTGLAQIYMITGIISMMQGVRILCLSDEDFATIYMPELLREPPNLFSMFGFR